MWHERRCSCSNYAAGAGLVTPFCLSTQLAAIDQGVKAFLWALFFFLYLWLGMLAVNVGKGTSFVVAAVAGGAIFLYIRIYGEDRPRRAER